jgi:hypothetical protein
MNTAVKSAWLLFVFLLWSMSSQATTISIPSTTNIARFEVKSGATVLGNGSLALYSNKSIKNPVQFVAGKTYKFSIAASGTPADGVYPQLRVAIDGYIIKTINLTTTAVKTYTFNTKVTKGGTRTLALSFVNDRSTATQDRNLFLKTLAIAAVTTTTTASTSATSSAGVLFSEVFSPSKYYKSTDGVTQLRSNGWGMNNEGVDGPLKIVSWPLDASKLSVQQTYVNSDDGAKYRRYLPPYNKTEIWAAWDEYRSADFDFGSTKDGAVNLYNTNVAHSGQMIHLYWGMSTGLDSANRTSGQDNARIIDVNIQSLYGTAPSQRWSSGDANIVTQSNWAMKRATAYRFKIHIKLNTPGYTKPGNSNASNGVVQIWVNNTKVLERTDVKFFVEGVGNYYIHSFQLGMSATNGGMPFANPSEIYRKNIVVSGKEVF